MASLSSTLSWVGLAEKMAERAEKSRMPNAVSRPTGYTIMATTATAVAMA